jgi:hypothetical protein
MQQRVLAKEFAPPEKSQYARDLPMDRAGLERIGRAPDDNMGPFQEWPYRGRTIRERPANGRIRYELINADGTMETWSSHFGDVAEHARRLAPPERYASAARPTEETSHMKGAPGSMDPSNVFWSTGGSELALMDVSGATKAQIPAIRRVQVEKQLPGEPMRLHPNQFEAEMHAAKFNWGPGGPHRRDLEAGIGHLEAPGHGGWGGSDVIPTRLSGAASLGMQTGQRVRTSVKNPTIPEELRFRPQREQYADLSTLGRKHIKPKNFALPGRRYPIEDRPHARNALARVAQHGTPAEQARVRAAVHRKYPGIGADEREEYALGTIGFVAPETQEFTPESAEAAMHSQREKSIRRHMQTVGAKYGPSAVHLGIGRWGMTKASAGAEPTTVHLYEDTVKPEAVREDLARQARRHHQIQVLQFRKSKTGPHTMHYADVHAKIPEISQGLANQGIDFHTVHKIGKGRHRVYVYDETGEHETPFRKFAHEFQATPRRHHGTGEFWPPKADLPAGLSPVEQTRAQRRNALRAYHRIVAAGGKA